MKIITRYLGYLLIISAFFRIIPVITAIIYNEPVLIFLISAGLSLLVGIILVLTNRQRKKHEFITIGGGFILAAISFIILPVFGAISFLHAFDYSFINAFFESVSGFTTTGLTLFSDPDGLPRSLLIWRAETQWLGGVGIIMFFLFLFSYFSGVSQRNKGELNLNQNSMVLYRSQGFDQKLEGSFKNTLKNVIYIYIGYTIIGIMALYFSGVETFRAICLTFTSLSTGGFSITNDFQINNITLIILIVLMLIGSVSFITHNRLIRKKIKEFFFEYEKNVLLITILIFALISFIFVQDVRIAFFETVSAVTTTGYSLSEISLLPQIMILLIFLGMIIGGSSSSTSGGIKIKRIYTLIRAIPWYMKKKSSPSNAIIPFNVHGDEISEEKVENTAIFAFVYFFILFIGTVIFMIFGFDFLDSSFQVVSALGTVGLQTMDLIGLNVLLKFVLILAMIFGRLEIFPLLLVLKKIFIKK